jgi:hypothetical protein
MWKIPTHETLSLLIMQGLTDAELASYHGCGIKLIQAFLEEFGLKNNIRRTKQKPIFKGEVGCTIEEHISPQKKWRMRFCLNCEKTFQSEGIENRICDSCKNSQYGSYLNKQYEGTGTG